MKKNSQDNFVFFCPIEKAETKINPETGEEIMKLGGIASTADKDSDSEYLDPKGFDIKPLLSTGLVNWHHQAKGQPSAIIGEPTKAEIRKDGLYIETELYPSSSVARQVWDLAKTLDKDSKTRHLGYSIEGKVLKRKSNDKTSADYNKIEKAMITGVAVTHMPKNPKTFANIIKGEIDEDDEDDSEDNTTTEKDGEGLNTENAKALKKESLDKKIKNQTFGKAEVLERIIGDLPTINKANIINVYNLIQKISNMRKSGITEEDIKKAYGALGLEIENDPDIEKADEDDDEEETTSKKTPKKKAHKEPDGDEGKNPSKPSDDDGDEEKETTMKKANEGNRFDRIEKAINDSLLQSTGYIKAVGVLVKDVSMKTMDVQRDNAELREIIKSQQDTINDLSDRIESLGSSAAPAPRSIRNVRPIERDFKKSNDDELNKGDDEELTVISASKHRAAVSDALDQATFAKGFDDELSQACVEYEASGQISKSVISRMKNEFGIKIVE